MSSTSDQLSNTGIVLPTPDEIDRYGTPREVRSSIDIDWYGYMQKVKTAPNGYVDPYPHNDFEHPCTNPCCELWYYTEHEPPCRGACCRPPKGYDRYLWPCQGVKCRVRLEYPGMCVACWEAG